MRKQRIASRDRPGLFRYFVRSIRPTAAPGFHFLHVRFPHSPWQYLPSGKTYFPFQRYLSLWNWSTEEWWTIEAYQRHLLQVAFADRLLGELLDRLERTGLYEPALLAVMADHGVNFWPGENHRFLTRDEAHEFEIVLVTLGGNGRVERRCEVVGQRDSQIATDAHRVVFGASGVRPVEEARHASCGHHRPRVHPRRARLHHLHDGSL